MTTRRTQANDAMGGLPTDIDSMLEKQIKAEQTRKEYQNRPDVIEKRKVYQQKQQTEKAVARAAMSGNTAKLVELGYTDDQAAAMISRASELSS